MFSELFSRRQLVSILKWTLYALLFLFAMLLQQIVLPKIPIGGITLCVVPICAACVGVQEGAEHTALYGLLCGAAFCLSGVSCGPIYLIGICLSAVLAGALCDQYYTRSFASALLLSVLGLVICEGSAFLFRLYIGTVAARFWQTVLIPEILLSLFAFPLFYLGAWAISKIGR